MTNEAILERVRKLLAKAEHPSTPAAEAEAFSEKAAALIARYAIDDALLAERNDSGAAPEVRTVRVHAPYSLPKSVLLTQVASAHRVRVIIGPAPADDSASTTCHVVGFAVDLEMAELLFTSLLLQATSAMLQSGEVRRVRSYRRAFLLAFAYRIGARLRDLNAEAVQASAAVDGTSAELVLARREDRVDEAVREAFPRLRPMRFSSSHPRGATDGAAAGSRADLGAAQRRFSSRRGELGA